MTTGIPIRGIDHPKNFWQLQNHDKYGSENCGPYSASAVIAFETGGRLVTGAQIRAASNEPIPDPHDPGLNMPQIIAAVAHFGVNLIFAKKIPAADLDSSIKAGHAAVIFIDYAVIHGTEFAGQENFVGLHAVARFPGDVIIDPLADGRRRGIPIGPQVWPLDLIHTACGKYPNAGAGFVYAAVSPHAFPLQPPVVHPHPKPPVVKVTPYIATGNVWEHSKPNFALGTRVRVLKRGSRFLVTSVHGNMATDGHVWVATRFIRRI